MIELRPISITLLTDLQAAQVLLLQDDGCSDDAARKRLNRLVDQGLVRPCLVGNHRRYSVKELDRFIDARTDHYGSIQ